jgi:hypothetical protein
VVIVLPSAAIELIGVAGFAVNLSLPKIPLDQFSGQHWRTMSRDGFPPVLRGQSNLGIDGSALT